jgi:hypothetical protein
MIHAIGDSHANATFAGVANIARHTVGPMTMWRAGRGEDSTLADAVAALNLQPTDVLILCFGEPDIRRHVYAHTSDYEDGIEGVLRKLSERYLTRATTLPANGAQLAILSVTPPTRAPLVPTKSWPFSGNDAERAYATVKLNELLRCDCEKHGMLYVDVFAEYVDEQGMMDIRRSSDTVHVTEWSGVLRVLGKLGLPVVAESNPWLEPSQLVNLDTETPEAEPCSVQGETRSQFFNGVPLCRPIP